MWGIFAWKGRKKMNYRSTRNYENMEQRIYDGVGKYGIPEIQLAQFDMPKEFVAFSAAAQCQHREDRGVHFFIDDYRFNRLWTAPDKYLDMLRQFQCVMTPDFSLYTDFPKAVQIYNHYRKHWVGAYLQENDIPVIPTIGWSDESSFEWCFDGEPAHSIVAVSSVGTQKNKESKELFLRGYKEMVRRLEPETIIFYGKVPEECLGNIVRIHAFQEKFNEAKCNGW